MASSLHLRRLGVTVGALLVFAVSYWPMDAQTPAKRPLSYDAVVYWRSIQGPRLSNDGQWLAYALTSAGEDPELVVRNLRSGQEFRNQRGTGAAFTPDGKFVVFTIPLPKAEEEANASQTEN